MGTATLVKRFLRCDPHWPEGTPPDVLLTRTIYGGVSFVAFPDLWPYVGHCLELGLDINLVIARESGDPAQYYDWATSDWMIPRMVWTIGNEPTSTGPSSWRMTPDEYRSLWTKCRRLHGARWVAGMADGDPEQAKPYLQPDMDGLTVHIYTLSPTQAKQKVKDYQALEHKVRIGETHAATGYRLSDYTWSVDVTDFCYSEKMVEGFGLYA